MDDITKIFSIFSEEEVEERRGEEEEEEGGRESLNESDSLTKDSSIGFYGTFVSNVDREHAQVCKNQDGSQSCPGEEASEQLPVQIAKAKFWLAFACVLFNEFIASFDSTLMASIHPVITSYFSASSAAPWLSTSFLITSTAFMPLFAPLSDIIGRRTVWSAASAIFTLALVWCASAPSIGSFIAARTLCGLSAGGIYPMGSIILNDLVPIERRGTFQSCLVLSFGLGQASGAALGGLLCDTIGWRGAFWVQIPGFVVCSVVSHVVVPKSLGPQLGKPSKGIFKALIQTFDFAGVTVLALSVTCLILYLNLGRVVLPWSHPAMIVSLIASVVLGGFFLFIETKVPNPVMPIRLLRGAPRANINYVNFLGAVITAAIIFNAPLYFEAVKRDSPTVAGLRLIAPFLALAVSGFLSCMTMSSVSLIRPAMLFGAVTMLAGSVSVAFLNLEVSSWGSLMLLVPASFGQGFMFPATYLCVLRTSPHAEHAVVTSTLMLWRRLGSVLGVAVSTLVVQNRLSFYLDKYISGPDQMQVKVQVLKSVRAISDLDSIHQEQAIAAYAAALRLTFASTIFFAVLLIALILPARLEKSKRFDESSSSLPSGNNEEE